MPSGVDGSSVLDLWRAWYFPSVETRLWIRADHALRETGGPLEIQLLTSRGLHTTGLSRGEVARKPLQQQQQQQQQQPLV